MHPKVSIILSAYNAEDKLEKTIESVLAQNFSDFEFIIIDDASKDATSTILAEAAQKDKRVILIKNEKNIGLTRSLNEGIAIAKGQYIARIDTADLWDKTKLRKQVTFLDENQDYVICGSQAFFIDQRGKVLGKSSYSGSDQDIKMNFFTREMTFFHPSIVFRNIGVKYRDFFRYSQDFDLYCRLYFKGKLYCFDQPLISSKFSTQDMTIQKRYYQRQYYNIAHRLFLQREKYGKDDLDIGLTPIIKETKLGLKFCSFAMFFMFKYIGSRVSGKKSVVPLVYLFLGCLIYPPFMADYFLRIKNIIIYKKFNLKSL